MSGTPKQFTAVGATLAGVIPTVDGDGIITALEITLDLNFLDMVDGVSKVSTQTRFDIWPILSGTQQTNMQDISNALNAYIATTFFGA